MKILTFFGLDLRYNLNSKMQHSELTFLFGCSFSSVILAHLSWKVQPSGHLTVKEGTEAR